MKVFWMHTDCMGATQTDDAIFIFDPAQIEREQWGLKRLVFLYESVPAKVQILKGDAVSILKTFDEVVTQDTPDPWIRGVIQQLSPRVTVLPEPAFAGLRPFAEADLKRFSRYWKKAEAKVLG